VLRQTRTESDDTSYTFVAANVRELDGCDGRAIGACSCSGTCVKICC